MPKPHPRDTPWEGSGHTKGAGGGMTPGQEGPRETGRSRFCGVKHAGYCQER